LVVLFLGIALVLMATLAWLGWKLFQQDRALERQRVEVRLERAADVVAAELTGRLAEIEDELGRLSSVPSTDVADAAEAFSAQFSSDAAVLVLEVDGLEAYPNGRLLYYPEATPAPEAGASVFAEGEAREFRRHDLAGAARVYRRLAESRDATTRAGALLRLGRTERKAGHVDAALSAYADLSTLGRTPVMGLPAELVGRHARLSVLEQVSRADELRDEAAALNADLHSGRWHLSHAQYEYHETDVCQMIDCSRSDDAAGAGESLAAAAEWLWSARSTLEGAGHQLVWLEGRAVLAVWHRSAGRTMALVGGSTHVTRDWLEAVAPTLQEHGVRVALTDVNGNAVTASDTAEPDLVVTRPVADTRLPWTLRVASADPAADFAQLRERRRLMLLGLLTLALFVAVGLYAVLRGVSRELEVARLQSDFVAAVSHEFRTPLTSLKQLAELLASGRVASDERRVRYYGVMERESGRLHRLVEGLLDFGRMEAGALEFNWERVTPGDLVRGVVRDFEEERTEDRCRVEVTVDTEVPAILADSEAIGRAVWNLLDNAAKYSPEKCSIRVGVSRNERRVAIAVGDEGVGIPQAEQATIFRKFVRGSSSGGGGVKGTGIGLAMVKHIVEAHGGEIRVESQVGRGSTFTILLPVEE